MKDIDINILKQKYDELKSLRKTALYFGIDRKTASRYLKANNKEVIQFKDKFKDEDIVKAFEQTKSYLQASKILGTDEATIKRRLNRLGIYSEIKQFGNLKHSIDVNIFKTIDSEEKAYWLGFIAADGCVYQTKTSYIFQINLSVKDLDHLKKFQQFLKTDYEILIKDRVCTLQIPSKSFCKNLINQSIVPRKTKIYQMPSLREDLIRHYLRGYFDGDGCISYYEKRNEFSFELVSASKSFIDDLKVLLPFKTHLVIKRDKKYPDSEYYYLRIGKKKEIFKAYQYLYQDATVYLDRKYQCFNKIQSHFPEMEN